MIAEDADATGLTVLVTTALRHNGLDLAVVTALVVVATALAAVRRRVAVIALVAAEAVAFVAAVLPGLKCPLK